MGERNKAVLLLVDDDEIFTQVLGKALTRRGHLVKTAHDVCDALALARQHPPQRAIVDLQMPGASGLDLIPQLKQLNPEIGIVVLTGYASIATAVEAIKLGATHYLTKPADADEILAAFERTQGATETPIAKRPISVNRLEWEHIQKVLKACDGNISAAARQLNMHRRTLQRKLKKRPVRD